jgi:hypothetical protein
MFGRRSRNVSTLSEHRVRGQDRRGAPRYAARGTPAVIGWAEGDQHRTTPAILVDMSMGGLSAWVETFPPPGAAVWFRLDGESPSPWLKVSVVATGTSGRLVATRRHIRLRFLEPCTYDLFKRAVDGFTRERDLSDQSYDGFDTRYWR